MSRALNMAGGLLVLFLTGCSTVPFKPVAQTDMSAVSAEQVREQFIRTQNPRYEALQSVVFELFGRQLTGLGYLAVDEPAETFALSCMTPMGMKLFDIQGQGDQVETTFALAQLGKREALAAAVGSDLQRTWFNNIPAAEDMVSRDTYRLTFVQERADGRTEYDFGGPDHMMLEKRIYAERKLVCRIRYYDYAVEQDGFSYPHGIVLQNRVYHYRLILRLKAIYPTRDLPAAP